MPAIACCTDCVIMACSICIPANEGFGAGRSVRTRTVVLAAALTLVVGLPFAVISGRTIVATGKNKC